MSEERKPDGWVAYTDRGEPALVNSKGDIVVFSDYERCELSALESPLTPVGDRGPFAGDREIRRGWEVNPVYLVDASPDSEEVVVPRRLLAWCHKMATAHRRSLETLNCDDELNEILEGYDEKD